MADPGTQLQVRADHDALRVSGELDIRTCGELERIAGQRADTGQRVVLDLSELTFCDSTGLAGLVRLHKRATAAGGSLVLRAPSRRVQNLLSMTGLNRLLAVEP